MGENQTFRYLCGAGRDAWSRVCASVMHVPSKQYLVYSFPTIPSLRNCNLFIVQYFYFAELNKFICEHCTVQYVSVFDSNISPVYVLLNRIVNVLSVISRSHNAFTPKL